MDARPQRLGPRAIGLLLLLLAVARGPLARDVAPFDTTFVTARLADHAAVGEGVRYNLGLDAPQPARPIASPLGLVLVTALVGQGLPAVGACLTVSFLAELMAAALLLRLLAHRPVAAAAAVVLLAATPELGEVVAGGGAAPLALALTLGACLAATGRNGVLTGVLAGLATAAAPEAALALPGIWLAWRREPARIGVEALGFAAVVAPAAWAMVHLTGHWQPTPLASGAGWGPALPGVGAIVLLFLALRGGWQQGGAEVALRPLLVVGALAAVPWLLIGGALDLRAAYLPLAALIVPASFAVEHALKHALGARVADRRVALAALVLVALGSLALPRKAADLRREVWGPLESWAEDARVQGSGEHLLASEIGLAGWFAGGVVHTAAEDEAALVAQLVSLQPEYLLLRAGRPELSALRASGDLARAWYPIGRLSAAGETDLEPELDGLCEHPCDDYLLFVRRL